MDENSAYIAWVNAAKENEIRLVYMVPDSLKVYKRIKDKVTGEILYDSRWKQKQ